MGISRIFKRNQNKHSIGSKKRLGKKLKKIQSNKVTTHTAEENIGEKQNEQV